MSKLIWTEELKPNPKIRYNHVLSETPFGLFSIEWKSWKENDSFSLNLDGEWIKENYDLDEAKKFSFKIFTR